MKQVPMQLGKQTGSVMNWMRSNNNTTPVVGEGATELLWTDRHAYTILTVSNDNKKVTIQRDRAERTDGLGMSDSQKYVYHQDEKGQIVNLAYRHGAWRKVIEEIVFIEEFSDKISEMEYSAKQAELKDVFADGEMVLVEGKTRTRTRFEKFNVQFGTRAEYYDYSF